jgi:hypothetical protein
MSRIYVVTSRADKKIARYVRANNLNAAVRALADELYTAQAATHDQLYAAHKGGYEILDAARVTESDDEMGS